MLVFNFYGGRLAEVDFDALAHYRFAIEDLSDADRGVFVEEGDNDAAEGLERGPGMDGGGGVDELFDGLEIVCAEDFGILQVRDEEGV